MGKAETKRAVSEVDNMKGSPCLFDKISASVLTEISFLVFLVSYLESVGARKKQSGTFGLVRLVLSGLVALLYLQSCVRLQARACVRAGKQLVVIAFCA